MLTINELHLLDNILNNTNYIGHPNQLEELFDDFFSKEPDMKKLSEREKLVSLIMKMSEYEGQASDISREISVVYGETKQANAMKKVRTFNISKKLFSVVQSKYHDRPLSVRELEIICFALALNKTSALDLQDAISLIISIDSAEVYQQYKNDELNHIEISY